MLGAWSNRDACFGRFAWDGSAAASHNITMCIVDSVSTEVSILQKL